MNINDVTVSWQDISDTERTALLNKPCPPRSKPKVHPPRKTPDRLTSRVFSICQSAVMNNHTLQRPVRLHNFKNHTTLTSSKENVDNAYRTMIEFTETCKRESNNESNPNESPMAKRIRSSSPTSNLEQCSSPSAISRYTSHDSYLTYIPPSAEQRLTTNSTSNVEIDFNDDELWDDWDLSSTSTTTTATQNKKTSGKIRTMSSPAVHSRINQITEPIKLDQSSLTESTLAPINSNLVWDDDDDFEQLLSQLPAELPSEKPLIDNDSVLITTTTSIIDDENSTRLDATRRSSAMLNTQNQSLIHNTTKIELSSQPNPHPQNRISSTAFQRSNTGPLSPIMTRTSTKINSPRVRCDSAVIAIEKKKICTEAEIEQKRLAALAIRRQREQEQQHKKR